jgi:ubiquitin-like modifier-activating enzyme ATG7
LKNPQILSTFALITFSDLKKYKFYYWFAFPALIPPLPFTSTPPTLLQDQFPVESFSNSYQSFKSKYAEQSGFFLVKKKQDGVVVIRKLGDWSTFWSSSDIITVGFVDPSAQKSNPGWPLRFHSYFFSYTIRNFLFLIQKEFNLQHVDVIALRDTIEDSIHFQVHFDTSQPISHDFPLVIGWEKGPKGTPTPRVSDLGPMMNPARY